MFIQKLEKKFLLSLQLELGMFPFLNAELIKELLENLLAHIHGHFEARIACIVADISQGVVKLPRSLDANRTKHLL